MTTEMLTQDLPLPVSQTLVDLLTGLIQKQERLSTANSIVMNFRDQSYSAETGGFHPVEIRLYKQDALWRLDYITDFSYQGAPPFAELAKEIDFNLHNGIASSSLTGDIGGADAHELYQLWEDNFLAYADMGCYDQIEVTLD